MATQPLTPQPSGPNTTEAFVADREVFWTRFTRAIVYAVTFLAVALILMAIFLT